MFNVVVTRLAQFIGCFEYRLVPSPLIDFLHFLPYSPPFFYISSPLFCWQSLHWEAISRLDTKEIHSFYGSRIFITMSRIATHSILWQATWIQFETSEKMSKNQFNIILLSAPRSLPAFLSVSQPFHSCHIYHYFSLLDVIILIMLYEYCKLWSYSLSDYLRPSTTSSRKYSP